ncbi:hypothetical protein [Sphingomicrobium arenosum]|uniref:hypothetical protein n=1 Tax=Sphingomicrobium arenosum TaxID=2233861 RepID=UPI002240EFF9|nr:hypothetical protein [Sphingomicrobium arenosum]
MQLESLVKLAQADDVHAYVDGLWSDGPIRQSHREGGVVYKVIERFARLPRFFFRPSEQTIEWTHFSPWWGGILLADYDNAAIRDLRFLHEIYHAATMPYVRAGNVPTFAMMNFRNEREASCFTEMAIYAALPELRATTFDHPIFVDRFLFPQGDFSRPDVGWVQRWQADPELTFQQLLYERMKVILAPEEDVDRHDPQVVWLRRYGAQGDAWVEIWSRRFRLVQERMLDLQDEVIGGRDRGEALDAHLDWLLAHGDGTDVPFRAEAEAFRATFDDLITVYDEAMKEKGETAVRGRGEDW